MTRLWVLILNVSIQGWKVALPDRKLKCRGICMQPQCKPQTHTHTHGVTHAHTRTHTHTQSPNAMPEGFRISGSFLPNWVWGCVQIPCTQIILETIDQGRDLRTTHCGTGHRYRTRPSHRTDPACRARILALI